MDAKTAELFRTAGNGLIAFANKSEECAELAALYEHLKGEFAAVVEERDAAIDEGIRVSKQFLRLRKKRGKR